MSGGAGDGVRVARGNEAANGPMIDLKYSSTSTSEGLLSTSTNPNPMGVASYGLSRLVGSEPERCGSAALDGQLGSGHGVNWD